MDGYRPVDDRDTGGIAGLEREEETLLVAVEPAVRALEADDRLPLGYGDVQHAVPGGPGLAGQDGAPVAEDCFDLAQVDAVQPLAVPHTITLFQAFLDIIHADEAQAGAVQDPDVDAVAGEQVTALP